MKMKVKYLSPTLFSGAKFFIHQLSEILKILAPCYWDAKESTNPGRKFSDFYGLSHSYPGSKSNLQPRHRNISYGYANLEIVYFVPLDISICCMSRVFEPASFFSIQVV